MSLYIILGPLAGLFKTEVPYIILSLLGVSGSERIHFFIALGPALLVTADVGRIVVKGSEGLWVHSSPSPTALNAIKKLTLVTMGQRSQERTLEYLLTRPSSPIIPFLGPFAQETELAAPISASPSSLGDVLLLSDPRPLNVGREYVSQTGVDSIGGVVTSTPEWIEDETYNPWHHDPALEVDEHE
ncbi:hypothetical protein VNI00_013087 [Paramarasmius palmivorus]|uniref:Uncharacterized protein n=1 Tax=Paramarasmius palmivorus TaxID=297713 RepID=A0AAW0BZM9_9AGAR